MQHIKQHEHVIQLIQCNARHKHTQYKA